MGCFDTLHSDDHAFCVQVKCLGKRLGHLHRGDRATLHAMPDIAEIERLEAESTLPLDGSVEALDAWASHPATAVLLRGTPRSETSWQILVGDHVAVFRDSRFDGFSDDIVDGLGPIVDNSGRDAERTSTNRGAVLDSGWGCSAS